MTAVLWLQVAASAVECAVRECRPEARQRGPRHSAYSPDILKNMSVASLTTQECDHALAKASLACQAIATLIFKHFSPRPSLVRPRLAVFRFASPPTSSTASLSYKP